MGRGGRGKSTASLANLRKATPASTKEKSQVDFMKDWLNKQSKNAKIADLWDSWIRNKNLENRKVMLKALNGITPLQIQSWAASHSGLTQYEQNEILQGVSESVLAKADPLSSNEKELLQKILNYGRDNGLSIWDIIEDVKTNQTAASALQKSATKQNPYEPLAAEWITRKSGLKTYQLGNKETKLDLRFNLDGSIDVNKKASESDSKSVDLITLVEDGDKIHVILSAHKFARQGGGHQDNQLADATTYLVAAKKAARKNIPELHKLVEKITDRKISQDDLSWEPALILDGDYFRDPSKGLGKAHRNRFIGNSDEFAVWVKNKK